VAQCHNDLSGATLPIWTANQAAERIGGSSASSDQEFLTEGDRVIGSAFEAAG
jgi:hypothetical protein